MFEHHVFGSQHFLDHLRGELRGWAESRARRHAMYAQQAAPTSSAVMMQAVAGPRPAPPAGPAPMPTDGLVLVCYRHEQGQFVPVYAHAADIPVAAAPASTPPSGDGAPGPEAAPHVASGPASPPPEASPPAKPAATAAPPPNFYAQSVEASSPPRPSAKQTPMLDLSRPTPPPLIRASEEKAETSERILAQHRADMEAAEARHATAVQGILAGHRSDMEAAEARHKAAVQEMLAGHRSDMEAAEARQTAAVQSALAEHMRSISDQIASRREPVAEQARPDADAQAFAQLRELLTEQAGVMKDEHARTTGAIRDITEMIASLGETVNRFVVGVAEQKALRDPATNTATPATTPVIHETALATAMPSQGPPPNVGATASVTSSTPAPAVQEAAPAISVPSQPAAEPQGPAPNAGVSAPAAPSPQAPTRPLTVVRDSEPIREAPPSTVRRTIPAAALSYAPAKAGATSLSVSFMSIFASAPRVTASATPTPRQRREAEEARKRDNIHDLVDDTPDEELEDVQVEGEAPNV